MYCPQCQFENREGAIFCGKCGHKFEILCPNCEAKNRIDNNFCDQCGYQLESINETFGLNKKAEIQQTTSQTEKVPTVDTPILGERKHVTVLFSDLTGYTAMSERLDPEEVKDITTQIFDEISKTISKYEGFIEKFAGDAVMALFGATTAHEDDPVRAITAAREIHNLVYSLSPKYEKRIGHPLSMHTGINTGLVVTGEVNLEKGTHGIAGDAINMAARLSDLGNAGDILVALNTYSQAQGYFHFKELEPVVIKGKSEQIRIFKVLSAKKEPVKIHRLDGLKAQLVGRKVEMNLLVDSANLLKQGKGSVISICGNAGTGKSRLVEDFKESLNLQEIQWLEGHAYPYSKNIPYHPLIYLLTKTLRIEEGDPPDKIKEKVESGLSALSADAVDVIPYIGSLFSIRYLEIENINPEFWKTQLQNAVYAILSFLSQNAPTIICLEDLHWADPSFMELTRNLLAGSKEPILFLCTYRPIISLFSSYQIETMPNPYHEIRLQDLSPTESQLMVESLLKSKKIPSALQQFIHDKVEGNPFYIEEVVNSLIETEALVHVKSDWEITRPITETDISSTIHGVISARLDRLDFETKRALQEAAVIGRIFYYDILNRITSLKDNIDKSLSFLERLDLISTRSMEPDLEYIFKHAITQEVVYNGLLKRERRDIHEQIGLVIEKLFENRLPEFYETLAFHFARGKSVNKAIKYLIKAGQKSLLKYSVEEAHQYYNKAYGILAPKEDKSEKEQGLLIDMLNSWGNVYYYLGENNEFIDLFNSNKALAETLGDKARLGMFYVWFGVALCMAGQVKSAYEYLLKALKLGEESDNQKIIGYACTWLPWVCTDLGLFDDGIRFGKKAQEIAKLFPSDEYLFYKSLGGLSFIYFHKGETSKVFEGANRLLEYGEEFFNSRSKAMGYWMQAFGHFLRGDLVSAQRSCEKSSKSARDPVYPHFSRIHLAITYFLNGQYNESETVSQSVIDFSEKRGLGYLSGIAYLYLSPIRIMKGQMQEGLGMIKDTQQNLLKNNRKIFYALSEYILGEIYYQIATGPKPSFSIIAKNIGFLAKNVPRANKYAEEHFKNAIDLFRKFGVNGFLGHAYLSLGRLYKSKKRNNEARECLSKAIQIYKECDSPVFQKQAEDALT
jgi:class 3 adenylate cyclase/tetratricopeptide (TPR) repeat protein